MQEVKSPKRPMMYYYLIAVLIMILLNNVVGSVTECCSVETVDYSTFMSSIENKTIDKVDISDDKIQYTEKGSSQVYQTGVMDDSG